MHMRTILFALTGVAALAVAAPASAQVYLGADERGAGVQVGPLGVGVGPDYDRHERRVYREYDDSYARGSCREVRSRSVRADGRIVYRTKRVCD
jgi:hypothetical protein